MNETMNREIMEISVEDIIPNRFQPRLTFDIDALNELANSIREHGIIQPLVVRRLQDKYEIIAGERRYKAASLIGMKKVPCIIMNLNDNESAEVAVIENIQRKEMTPLEEAKSFKKILDKGYLTQEELAKRMGKSQSSVANKLRLLNLDEVVQDAILEGKISERHARSLLKIDNKQEQRNVLSEIINNRLTVRQTDDLIKEKYGNVGDTINTNVNNDNNNQFNNLNMFNNQQSVQQNSVEFRNTNVQTNNLGQNSIFKTPIIEEKEEPNSGYNQPNTQYMSTPEVNIPMSNITNDVNPQLNLMHNLGVIDKTPKEEKPVVTTSQPSSSLDIFKFDNNTPIPKTNEVDIQSIINPSVFSNNTQTTSQKEQIQRNEPSMFNSYNSTNNGMFVDINEIKNSAEDINKKEEKAPDLSTLLSSNNKPENKFFVDLDMPTNFNLNSLDNQSPKVKNSVTELNKKIDELKLQGVNITKEETDLGSSYQIVIRIDK